MICSLFLRGNLFILVLYFHGVVLFMVATLYPPFRRGYQYFLLFDMVFVDCCLFVVRIPCPRSLFRVGEYRWRVL